jgi:hypothetical protein
VTARVKDGAAAIEAERFILHPIPFARGSLSPFATLATIAALVVWLLFAFARGRT